MSVQTSYSDTYAVGFAGMLADGGEHEIMSMVSVEASASMPFGNAVIFKSSNTTDQDALIPSGSSDKVAGIVVAEYTYAKQFTTNGTTTGDLSTTGLAPGSMLNVLRRGRIWIKTITACAPGDRGFVAYNGTGTATVAGTIAQVADGGHTIDLTSSIVYLTTALAGGLAIVEVDFTNKP